MSNERNTSFTLQLFLSALGIPHTLVLRNNSKAMVDGIVMRDHKVVTLIGLDAMIEGGMGSGSVLDVLVKGNCEKGVKIDWI